MKSVECLFHSDPSHGWLEVPLTTFLTVGAKLSEVSPYSYFGLKGFQMTLYLEEDCDISVFLNAAEKRGVKVQMPHVIYEGECFVRQLPPIPFEKLKEVMEEKGLVF